MFINYKLPIIFKYVHSSPPNSFTPWHMPNRNSCILSPKNVLRHVLTPITHDALEPQPQNTLYYNNNRLHFKFRTGFLHCIGDIKSITNLKKKGDLENWSQTHKCKPHDYIYMKSTKEKNITPANRHHDDSFQKGRTRCEIGERVPSGTSNSRVPNLSPWLFC